MNEVFWLTWNQEHDRSTERMFRVFSNEKEALAAYDLLKSIPASSKDLQLIKGKLIAGGL